MIILVIRERDVIVMIIKEINNPKSQIDLIFGIKKKKTIIIKQTQIGIGNLVLVWRL